MFTQKNKKNNYINYLRSPKWKRFRKQVFLEKGRICKCGRRATEIAHKNYKQIYKERIKDVDPSCSICNREEYLKRKLK